jgi:outer membrane beta-barrel protein
VNRTAPTLALAVALAALAPRDARGSAADAFENKVKPVSGQLYTKAGKLELTAPAGIVSFNDAFFTKYMVGARLGYHFTEWLSLGVSAAFGGTSPTGSTNICPVSLPCHPADQAQLNQVPGDIKWTGTAELAFSPVYGKLNVFAEKAIHFDLYLLAGGGLVAYRDVVGASPATVTAPAFDAGVGGRIFLAPWLALRLEGRDLLYSVSHLDKGQLQSQLFLEAGLSFFFPLRPQGER